MSDKPNVVECTYVQSDETEAQYFSTPWLLGKNGLEKNLGMGQLSDYEKSKLEEVWNWPVSNGWRWDETSVVNPVIVFRVLFTSFAITALH